MAGTRAGYEKRQKTILEKYGLNEDGKSALLSGAGKKGGAKKVAKGFAKMPKKKRIEAGKLGGKKSRRVYE